MQPKVLLLDEPFGALDALTRAHAAGRADAHRREHRRTVLMVTHDVDEAVLLSDRIVMMTNGPAATIGDVWKWTCRGRASALALATNARYIHLRGPRAGVPLPPPGEEGGVAA